MMSWLTGLAMMHGSSWHDDVRQGWSMVTGRLSQQGWSMVTGRLSQ
jgi:hypothetical protein